MSIPAYLQPLRSLVAAHFDLDRPVYRAQIVAVDRWSATGPAWVTVTHDGARRDVVYTDLPAPTIGMEIAFYRAGPAVDAEWLVVPWKSGQPLIFSAWDADVDPYSADAKLAGHKAIVARLAGGGWEKRSDHPIGYAEWQTIARNYNDPADVDFGMAWFPLLRVGAYLYTWGAYDGYHYWGPDGTYFPADLTTMNRALLDDAPNCYRSADWGATWELAPTVRAVRWLSTGAGQTYAVADDGESIYHSPDDGDTWSLAYAFDGTKWGRFQRVAADPLDDQTVAVAAAKGRYVTTDRFSTVAGPIAPAMFYEDLGTDSTQDVDSFPHSALARTPAGDATLGWFGTSTDDEGVVDSLYIQRGADPLTSFTRGQFANANINGGNHSQFWADGAAIYWGGQTTSEGMQWLYKSTDGGATWTAEPRPDDGVGGTIGDPLYHNRALNIQSYGAAGGMARTDEGLFVASSSGAFGGGWFADPFELVGGSYQVRKGTRRLWHLDDDGEWRDATGSMAADTGKNWAPFAHGMAVADE